MVRDLLISLPNLQRLELNADYSESEQFSDKHCADFCEGLKRSRSLKERLVDLDLKSDFNAIFEPLFARDRQYQLGLKTIMTSIARQETQLPLDIWRSIFRYLMPDMSIFKK